MNRFLWLLIAAFVLLVGLPAVNMFGWGGGSFALYFFALLVLLTLIFKKQLLVVVCLAAALFYFWRPFAGSGSAKSPPPCPLSARAASPLRGPYPSIDELMQCDGVGPYALQLTGSGTVEYGFVILRDRRRSNGAYYATSPVRSSQAPNPGCSQRPTVQPQDFFTSWTDAIKAAHVDSNNYVWAATVHTHPSCPMASNNFTATDFNQAIVLKNAPSTSVELEKIVMINSNDRKVRTFEPRPADQPFTSFGIEVSDRFLPYLNLGWDEYALRVEVIARYP